jgi:hypothetical protein
MGERVGGSTTAGLIINNVTRTMLKRTIWLTLEYALAIDMSQ